MTRDFKVEPTINGLPMATRSDISVVSVFHGSDATVARPEGVAIVIWSGSVEPDNWTDSDIWIDETGSGTVYGGGVEVGDTAPDDPEHDQLWLDTSDESIPVTTQHNDLQGLDVGDPHPQYTAAIDNATDGLVHSGAAKDNVFTFESTTSTSFTDLSTVGPQASVTVPDTGRVRVDLQAWVRNTGAPAQTYLAFELSGAVTQAPTLDQAALWDNGGGAQYMSVSTAVLFDGLTAGETLTVTAKYRTESGTAWYGRRRLIVTPQ